MAPPPDDTPRLVLLLVIDQLGTREFERLEPHFTAGYRRLVDQGVVFARGVHDHAVTETAAGHATISTGRYPRHHGVVSNWLVEPGLPEIIWFGDDDEYGKSPHRLMVPALGDWLKDRYPSARVFTVSAKARAAIMMGGQGANAAFWWEEEVGQFETSTHYELPDWFEGFLEEQPASRFYARVWEPLPLSDQTLAALEVENLDLGPLGETFPHVFGGLRPAPVETFYDDLWGSPWLEEHMMQLVQAILQNERLGADEIPDLLAVSFSVSDVIGHRYGPHSREYVDILLRQDRLIGELLDRIDAQVGEDRTLIVLTSDHGVLPVPEILERRGEPGARVDWQTIQCVQQVGGRLAHEHGVEHWLIAGGFLAPDLVEQTGLSRQELEERTARRLETCEMVEKVWTASELASAPATPLADNHDDERWLFANSYYPERTADFLIRFRESLMLSRSSLATHGTSYAYDREVPVIFMAPGRASARHAERLATVDIAPTVAALLDVPAPDGIDGKDRSQLLIEQSGSEP